MVGLEIEQARPGAEAHLLGSGIQRIGQPGITFPVTRPPFHGDAPERRVDEIGVAQRIQVDVDHFDAGIAQRRHVERRNAAVHVVDRVIEDQDHESGEFALATQQRVAQLGGQGALRRRVPGRAALAVEQEEVDHDVLARLADGRQ